MWITLGQKNYNSFLEKKAEYLYINSISIGKGILFERYTKARKEDKVIVLKYNLKYLSISIMSFEINIIV